MKYKCDKCGGAEHDISDLTINIDKKTAKTINDIQAAVMKVVEDKKVTLDVLVYALAYQLENTKQVGLHLGNEGHHIESVIHIARNAVIDDITQS